MLLLDEKAALAAIPAMLPDDADVRRQAFEVIKRILGARGDLSSDEPTRLKAIARLFSIGEAEAQGHLAKAS
jgi:hypothetical protein